MNYRGATVRFDKKGVLTLDTEIARGGQGAIYTVFQTKDTLIKVYDPDVDSNILDPKTSSKLINQGKIYQEFTKLNFEVIPELSCLPHDYATLPDNTPIYTMRRAPGEVIDSTKLREIAMSPVSIRLEIARSVALGIRSLHRSTQVVHADIKIENLFISNNGGDLVVYILDIDGGGYFGPGHQFAPTVIPNKLYLPPELVSSGAWAAIWNDQTKLFNLKTQPDLWALAVLIYQILVDPFGPFISLPPQSTTTKFGKGYNPYPKNFFVSKNEWPQRWQLDYMRTRQIPSSIIELFIQAFKHPRDIFIGDERPSADKWCRTFSRLVAPPNHSQVTPWPKPLSSSSHDQGSNSANSFPSSSQPYILSPNAEFSRTTRTQNSQALKKNYLFTSKKGLITFALSLFGSALIVIASLIIPNNLAFFTLFNDILNRQSLITFLTPTALPRVSGLTIISSPTKIPFNIVEGMEVSITTNGHDDRQEISMGHGTAAVTDGSLEYIPGSSVAVIGFANDDYNELMRITMTINFDGQYQIFRILYNQGDVMYGSYWNADTMETSFGITSTNPGENYRGAWSEQRGNIITNRIIISFTKTRISYETDWLFIGEIEIYGIPIN